MSDILISAVVGASLSLCIIWINTQQSHVFAAAYESNRQHIDTANNKSTLNKTNKSVETLELLYGVKETDVIQDQTVNSPSDGKIHQRLPVDSDAPSQDNSSDDDSLHRSSFSIIDWVVFIVMILFIGHVINEFSGGDFLRLLAAIFSREFEALGLREYVDRVRDTRTHGLIVEQSEL
jgi:hypothetical protein